MIAKGSGYVRGNREAARARLISHFKYIEHRSRELSESRDDRRIFDNEHDVVNRRDAVDEVMEHTSTSVNYHKVVLSPGDDEPIEDWRAWTREVMHDLEEEQGRTLHWYAVHHQNTEHPHVHVVIAGAGYNEETGREEPVKLYTKDYEVLRASGHEHSEYPYHQWLEAQYQKLNTLDETIDREAVHVPLDHDPFHPSREEFDR